MITGSELLVGLSEIQVAKGAAMFSILGLGSCLGIAIRDTQSPIGGVVHAMLPTAFANKPVEQAGKFASTGVPELIARLESEGANRSNLIASVVGGAQVIGPTAMSNGLDLGTQNVEAAIAALRDHGIELKVSDTGGANGRSMIFNLASGEIKVRTLSSDEKVIGVLC